MKADQENGKVDEVDKLMKPETAKMRELKSTKMKLLMRLIEKMK